MLVKKYYGIFRYYITVRSDKTMEMRFTTETYWSALWRIIRRKPIQFKRTKNLNKNQQLSAAQLEAIARSQT